MLGKSVHVVPAFGEIDSQILDLVEQYYSNHELPKEVVCRLKSIQETLQEEFEGLTVVLPQEGRLMDAVQLAERGLRLK